jgi:dTMP kinase
MRENRLMRGTLITFEGIEGSGKTTLMENVARAMSEKGSDPLLSREPGGTSLGSSLRHVLLHPGAAGINALAELMLFGADRAQHVAEVIRPALKAGRVVLCDRFSDATRAYQGYGRGLSSETVDAVDKAARGEIRPDMTILLDLSAETGLERARRRNNQAADLSESRIDEEELAFHRRVREGYLIIAGEEPERFLVLDGTLRPQELAEIVMREAAMRFSHAF